MKVLRRAHFDRPPLHKCLLNKRVEYLLTSGYLKHTQYLPRFTNINYLQVVKALQEKKKDRRSSLPICIIIINIHLPTRGSAYFMCLFTLASSSWKEEFHSGIFSVPINHG